MHRIPAPDFVAAWRAAPVGNWRPIAEALRTRHRHAAHPAVTDAETPWLAEVADLLDAAAAQTQGVPALRLRRMAAWIRPQATD